MSKKKWIIFGILALAVTAIIAGFCFVFLGNEIITNPPKSISVEKYDDGYYLVTDYSGEYGYQFRIEQLLDGEYAIVTTVNSTTNSINLSEQNLDISAGQKYRFSACYTTENNAGNSAFTDVLEWTLTDVLQSVDYSEVSFDLENELLSWRAVYLADKYVVQFVSDSGNVISQTASQNSFNTESIEVGNYKVYIVAVSGNQNLENSFAGKGLDVTISRKNEIVQVARGEDNSLTVKTTQKVLQFEIWDEQDLKATLDAVECTEVDELYVYEFDQTYTIFSAINFESADIKIKSLANANVLESDFVSVI